jgi:hypothetical protein
MSLRTPSQILAIASLSSPQLDAKAISAGSGKVPDLRGFKSLRRRAVAMASALGYGNLIDIRIKFVWRRFSSR